jgi:DNA-binding Xre family transcriptional regulator
MNVAINNRFGILLAEKRVKEKRNIPLSEVAQETGLPPKTLFAWQNNTVTRFDGHVINKICQYFGVQPGELFEYVPDPIDLPPSNKKARR